VDESPTPRRALPPVPPPARSATTVLAPPADETTWFDALDPMVDSMRLGPLDDGTAAGAARGLIRDSARQPVLDEALLAALDAAAKAAAARRAVTIDLPAPLTGSVPALPTLVAGPVSTAAPVAGTDLEDEPTDVVDDHVDEDELDGEDDLDADELETAEAPPRAPGLNTTHQASLRIAPEPTVQPAPSIDVAAEFARHDDFLETGRHALDQAWLSDTGRHHVVTDTGRHYAVEIDAEDDEAGPLTHRTVITRPSSARRWIPAGIGAGVLSIVAAVLLTSGFGSDAAPTGTDEAARTGEASTEAPATTTPEATMPGMNTLDLSGTVAPADVDTEQPTLDEPSTANRPQVATPPPARAGASAGSAGSSTGSSGDTTGNTGVVTDPTPTLTVVPGPDPSTGSSSSAPSSSASSSAASSSSSSAPGSVDPGTT
jgi:hypothetical protein